MSVFGLEKDTTRSSEPVVGVAAEGVLSTEVRPAKRLVEIERDLTAGGFVGCRHRAKNSEISQ